MWFIIKKMHKKYFPFVFILAAALILLPVKEVSAWEYRAQEGDTLESVALLAQCTTDEIINLNNLVGSSLAEGLVLIMPDFISASSLLELPVEDETDTPESSVPVIAYTDSELNLLARCIFAEAGAEDYEGQLAVAAVIINRVQNERFPDTITEVIYQHRQFECVTNGMINNAAPESCYQAALAALYGADNTFGALYFWAPSLVYSEFHESLRYICTIGGHVFATDEY